MPLQSIAKVALLNAGWSFWSSMVVASISSVIAHAGMTYCLNRLGVVA